MNSKAIRKQLLAAVAMVLVATIALGSSTYAWFATNNTVTAEGMSVTVKSDVTFLMIKAGAQEIEAIRNYKQTTDSAATATGQLYPAAHESITKLSDATATTGEAENATLTNWYYKYSTDPAVYGGSGKETSKTTIKNSDKAKYILINEFSLGLAEGSNAMQNIKVGNVTLHTTGDSAVKVLVVTDTAAEEFGASGTGSTVLQTSLTDDNVMHVWVYVYWDGNDEDVYTNGVADLQDTSVVVTFTGTPVVA